MSYYDLTNMWYGPFDCILCKMVEFFTTLLKFYRNKSTMQHGSTLLRRIVKIKGTSYWAKNRIPSGLTIEWDASIKIDFPLRHRGCTNWNGNGTDKTIKMRIGRRKGAEKFTTNVCTLLKAEILLHANCYYIKPCST